MKGVVVCPQPRAADVGAAILEAGGNAFDALVATAFAQMVNDPFMAGIGGMGTLHYCRAGEGSRTLDFNARAGSRVTPDMWARDVRGRTEISRYAIFDDFRSEIGYGSIMTPGTLAGLGRFHEQTCSKPWAELLAPAIAHAHAGVVVAPHARQVWLMPAQPGIPDGLRRLRATAESARVYMHPEGRLYEPGEVMRLPDYARTLERVASEGWADFYTGALADEILADLEANGAYVTREDFASYQTEPGVPVQGRYRGYVVRSNNPPGSGVTVIQILQILEHFDLATAGHSSARYLDLLARAMAAAHMDRNRYLGDPRFADVPVEMLVSPERAAFWAEKITRGEPIGARAEEPVGCTTHVTVWDAAGNVAALTHTLGTSAGVVTPGLGFNYNNSMKLFDPAPGTMNSIAAGKARTTGMCPTILFKDGLPVLAAGSPGGSVIISAVVQAIINSVDFGMSPVEAVTAPRIHCEGPRIHAEATVQGRVVEELRALGHQVEHGHLSFDPVMGRAHVVSALAGRLRGGADPRGGAGMAYAR
jgi:gamma-glutamyltranspeptidase/glutathione hydrolase